MTRARGLGDLVHPGRMAHGFIAAFREHRVFRLAIVMRFLFFLGIYPVQRLFLYYLSARFDIQSVSQVSVFIVIGVIVAAVEAWAAGLLSDRFGRLAVLRVVIVGGAVGVLGLAFAPVLLLVAVAGLLAAAAFGAFQSVNWAQLSDETPQGHGAEYLGLSNLATAGSSAIAGLFGPLSDLLQAWLPAGAYHITFGLAALIALSGLLPLHRLGEMRQDSDQAPPHAEHAENAEKRTSHREAGTGQGKKGGKHRSPASRAPQDWLRRYRSLLDPCHPGYARTEPHPLFESDGSACCRLTVTLSAGRLDADRGAVPRSRTT